MKYVLNPEDYEINSEIFLSNLIFYFPMMSNVDVRYQTYTSHRFHSEVSMLHVNSQASEVSSFGEV